MHGGQTLAGLTVNYIICVACGERSTSGQRANRQQLLEKNLLTVQILKSEKDVELIADEWDKLHETISPRLPFSAPLWVLSWWRNYKRAAGTGSDYLCVFTFRDSLTGFRLSRQCSSQFAQLWPVQVERVAVHWFRLQRHRD